MYEYFQRVIKATRANPDDRLLSHLIATIDPDQTDEGLAELLIVIRAIVVAAGDTTTFGLGGGMRLLVENPHLVAEIREDHDKLLAFVEETLRIVSPVQTLFRKAREDVEIGGVAIPKGAIIEARYGAGDLDPETFPCPYAVDLTRENIRSHVGFGVGPHACPGMVLARTEMEISFKALVDRMDNFRAARGKDSYEYAASYIAHGPVKAYIAFDQR
jgi:cytochrome P450